MLDTSLKNCGYENENLIFIETEGYSMWPFLRPGRKLIIKKVPLQTLNIGDIILFRKSEQLVCHRLVKKIKLGNGLLLYARGDNSLSLPEAVNEDKFLGKAIGLLKNGRIIDFECLKSRIFNRFIVKIAPFVCKNAKFIKYFYHLFCFTFSVKNER